MSSNHELVDIGFGSSIEDILDNKSIDNSGINTYDSANADEQLLRAIVNRDLLSLKDAVDKGASTKRKIGKDKLSSFACRNFDKDICDFLYKKGTSFKDLMAITDACIQADNPAGLDWLINNKKLNPSSGQTLDFFEKSIEVGSANCLIYSIDELNFDVGAYKNQHRINSFWFNAINSGQEKAIDLFFDERAFKKPGVNVIKEMLQQKWVYTNDLSVAHCEIIQKSFSKDKTRRDMWKEALPLSVVNKFLSQEGKIMISKLGFEFDSNKEQWGQFYLTCEVRTLVDGLINNGGELLKDIVMSKTGAHIICEHLFKHKKNKEHLALFLTNAKRDTKMTVIKALKDEAISFRDDNNNNILHYMRFTDTSTSTSFLKDLYKMDPDMFMTGQNNKGLTASVDMPYEARANIEKMYMTRELKDIKMTKETTNKRKI